MGDAADGRPFRTGPGCLLLRLRGLQPQRSGGVRPEEGPDPGPRVGRGGGGRGKPWGGGLVDNFGINLIQGIYILIRLRTGTLIRFGGILTSKASSQFYLRGIWGFEADPEVESPM